MFEPQFIKTNELRELGIKSVGENVLISKDCTIVGLENIEIGDNVRIDGYCTIIANGDGYLKLGSNIHIGAYSLLIAGAGIVMNDFSGLSQGVRIYSRSDDYSGDFLTNPTIPADFSNVQSGEVVLEKHVIIGTGTVILPNVKIKEGSAVGALSLVLKNLDAWQIYSGCPAKRLKARKRDLLELEILYLKGKTK
ncbi:MAG: acetyltransferase-like isoleucine patch superfamily enzyme [Alphaproteobacteria bacterium]|jgi:acetyltransferase-like isoleucine patch superfamily enzyme